MTEPLGPNPGSDPATAPLREPQQVGDAAPAGPVTVAPTAGAPTRAIAVLSVLVVLTLVAGVLLYVLAGGRSASAAVSDAVASSTADGTAQVTVVGSVTVGSTSGSFSASGGVDFGNDASALTVGGSVAGHQLTEKVDFVGGTAYVDDPQLASLVPGKQWISVDMSGLAGAAGSNGIDPGANPAAWLPMLGGQGDTVTSLGPSTVDGSPVQGYSVDVAPSDVEGFLSQANAPSWMRQMFSGVTVDDFTFKVYVDDAGLLRRVTVDTKETVASSTAVQLQESTTFSDYGSPVSVTAPTPGEVLTIQQVLHSLAPASGSGATA